MFEHYSLLHLLVVVFLQVLILLFQNLIFLSKRSDFRSKFSSFEEVGFLVFEVHHVFHAVHSQLVLLKFGSLLLPQVIFLFNIVCFFISIANNIIGSLSCLNLFWCNKFRATIYPTTTPRIIPSKMSRRLNKFT